jgi:hypothetical protein
MAGELGEGVPKIVSPRVHLFGGFCTICMSHTAHNLIVNFRTLGTEPVMELIVHASTVYTRAPSTGPAPYTLAHGLMQSPAASLDTILSVSEIARALGGRSPKELHIEGPVEIQSGDRIRIEYTVKRDGEPKSLRIVVSPD